MILIVALGNPGGKYDRTRHNVGWRALDAWCVHTHAPETVESKKFLGRYATYVHEGVDVAVLYPTTFMNHSGNAVRSVLKYHPGAKLIVVHDDVALPFGEVRTQTGKGAGGHNGVQSIIDVLGTKAFTRIRIGVAQKTFWGSVKRPAGEDMSSFVLGNFTAREEKGLPEILSRVCREIDVLVT